MANLRVLLQTHCNFTNNGSLSPSTFCPQVLGSMLKEVLTFSHLAERATYQLILFVTHKAPKICDKISSVPLTRYIKYVIKFKYCIYTNNNLSKKVLHGISYLNKFSVECQHIYIYIHTKIFIPVAFAWDYMFKSIYLIAKDSSIPNNHFANLLWTTPPPIHPKEKIIAQTACFAEDLFHPPLETSESLWRDTCEYSKRQR